jgi:hypothetical protein
MTPRRYGLDNTTSISGLSIHIAAFLTDFAVTANPDSRLYSAFTIPSTSPLN